MSTLEGHTPIDADGMPHPDARSPMYNGRALTVIGASILVLLTFAAFVGPLVSSQDYATQNHRSVLEPPTSHHWFGTARLGEDVLAQTLHGLQKSLLIGVASAVLATALAAVVGMLAGLARGAVDRSTMWAVDTLLVLPPILVIAVLSPLFVDRSWLFLIVAIAVFQWMLPARMIRARTLTLRVSGFVRAAETMGASTTHLMRRHLLPNMVPLLAIDCALTVATAVLAEAGLSYFGFGVQPPDISLGTLIATGSASAVTYPWVFLAPAFTLVLTVLGVGLVGEGVRRSREAVSA
ncbi:ABC transporter permease [Rhodococcus sp. NPDC058521]|uniref:ABC transporter permease n=1 Tax=Rhodococcus sp. NPDC058521 TaxID=3346536 RepID=UPI00365BFF2A